MFYSFFFFFFLFWVIFVGLSDNNTSLHYWCIVLLSLAQSSFSFRLHSLSYPNLWKFYQYIMVSMCPSSNSPKKKKMMITIIVSQFMISLSRHLGFLWTILVIYNSLVFFVIFLQLSRDVKSKEITTWCQTYEVQVIYFKLPFISFDVPLLRERPAMVSK